MTGSDRIVIALALGAIIIIGIWIYIYIGRALRILEMMERRFQVGMKPTLNSRKEGEEDDR